MVALRAGALVDPLASAIERVATVTPTVVHTRADAELALRSRARDVVVFDPEVIGISILSALQADGAPLLVGWLRARSPGRSADLLDSGADEVVDGAMPEVELSARLRRVARTGAGPVVARPASFHGLSVDARRRTASWHGSPLALTPRETEVLQVLVAGAGLTVPRDVVYRQVWRWAMPRGDRTVDVNVKRLRNKLAAAGVAVQILSDPGIGYRLSAVDAGPTPDPAVTDL